MNTIDTDTVQIRAWIHTVRPPKLYRIQYKHMIFKPIPKVHFNI